jgi:hypothetical protein
MDLRARLRPLLARVWPALRNRATALTAGGITTLVVGVLAGHFLWENERRVVQTKLLPPDTPPAEYLYLDSPRVLAYLGQIEGGLTKSEKRIASQTESRAAALKGGLLAEISGSAQSQTSIEQVVTPAATDRFFSLLIKLRSGREERNDRSTPWLHNIDARLTEPAAGEGIRRRLTRIHEGQFVRIYNAHLYLPPYAAVAPRARYSASYLGGDITQPRRPLYAPISQREQQRLTRYLAGLGPDPVLPFVLPTLTAERHAESPVTFFVPARYSGLLDNARLLAGNLTVVGKVTYIDPRNDEACLPKDGAGVACSYFDRQTLATFAPALQASKRLLPSLGMNERDVERSVRASVTFRAPVVVVLPLAIYQ